MSNPKPFVPGPEPVSLEDGRKALDALRARGRVDVDAFLNKLDVTRILEGPIGPTEQCLTLNQLEQYAFNPVTELPHLAECASCTNALRAYRAVKERPSGPLRQPWRIPVPQVISFGVAVPEVIDLVPAEFQFDVMLQADSVLDVLPADIKVANAVFSDIHCQAIDMVDSDPETGWTYRASCIARRKDELLSSFQPGAEFVDWIRVSGKNKTGQTFAASDLARFSVSEGISAVVYGKIDRDV